MAGQAHPYTTDLDELMNDVRLEIPALTELAIEHALRRTIIEFCEKSHFWQEEIGPVLAIRDVPVYEVAPSRYYGLVQVKEVLNDSGERLAYGEGNPEWSFVHDSPSHIRLMPIDRMVGHRFGVIAALKPKEYKGEFRVSERVLSDYFDALCAGTKSRLMRVPGKEYTNPDYAMAYWQQFEQAANDALVRAGRDFARVSHRVASKPRSFF